MWRRCKSQRSLRIAHDNSSLSLQPTIPATFLFHGVASVFEGGDLKIGVRSYLIYRRMSKFVGLIKLKIHLVATTIFQSHGRETWSFPPLFPMIWRHVCCSMRACAMRAGTWGFLFSVEVPWSRVDLRLDSAPGPSRTGVLHVDPFMTWKQHQNTKLKGKLQMLAHLKHYHKCNSKAYISAFKIPNLVDVHAFSSSPF